MTREQLIQAMSLFYFAEITDYTIDQDYASITMVNPEITKPSEANLQASYDSFIYEQNLSNRVAALGDIAILIDKYFQDNAAQLHSGDSWNSAGFESDKIDTNFGWNFQELPKPDIDQLEAIKALLEA